MWGSDPVRDAERYEAEKEQMYIEWVESRPECCICGFHIEEQYAYLINGDWYCDDCIADSKKRIPD